ncbi:MAG: hypothetical protein HOC74_04950 [Gemmatimonadetes bacterium]|jgi:hypothetical protein|nr:hypothetical protein [Gemmatimonadota bacterium]
MASKEEITETLKAQFTSIKERGKVLAQMLKARADIAATRRRMRSVFADLGEEVYGRMAADQEGAWSGDDAFDAYKARIEGLQAELNQQELVLQEVMAGKEKKVESDVVEEAEVIEEEKEEEEA